MDWWIILLAAANAPVYVLVGWVFFDHWDKLVDTLRDAAAPDIVAAFHGGSWEQWKFYLFVGTCALFPVGEYLLLRHLGWWPR